MGFIYQIIICAVAFVIVSRVRTVKIDWKGNNLSLAFFLAAIGMIPLALFGAFGSPTDVLLGLLAGLSLGLLAAVLIESTTGNKGRDRKRERGEDGDQQELPAVVTDCGTEKG